MSWRLLVAVAVMVLGRSPRAVADVFDGLDMSIGSGALIGSVKETQTDGTVKTFQIGGIPFAAMLNRDLAQNWSGSLGLQVMIDVANQQLERQGFAGMLCYHLLGGARRLVTPGNTVKLSSRNDYNLSLAVRGGIFNYAAANRNNPNENLSGGVWEMASGLEYRKNISEQVALGASFMVTILTLPASVQRLTTRTQELMVFWRVYL